MEEDFEDTKEETRPMIFYYNIKLIIITCV